MNTISKRRKKMRERRCEEIVVCPSKCRNHGAIEGGKEKKEKRRRRRKRKKQD